MKKSVGLGIKSPKKECIDKKCPFHSALSVKPELYSGVVVKKDVNNSATIVGVRALIVQKYERRMTKRSRFRVHNPLCVDAQIGDRVLIAKSRPLSKTKNHVIVSVVNNERS